MKIRVITPFTDKMFHNEILRKVGDIIDTEDESFRCDEALARNRIEINVCEEVKEEIKKETPIKEVKKAKGKKEIKK